MIWCFVSCVSFSIRPATSKAPEVPEVPEPPQVPEVPEVPQVMDPPKAPKQGGTMSPACSWWTQIVSRSVWKKIIGKNLSWLSHRFWLDGMNMLRLAKQTPVRVVPWPNGERGGSLPGENDHVEAGELCDSLGTGCGGLVMVLRWLIISPFKSFILNPADDCVHKRAIFTSTNLDHPFGSICL